MKGHSIEWPFSYFFNEEILLSLQLLILLIIKVKY